MRKLNVILLILTMFALVNCTSSDGPGGGSAGGTETGTTVTLSTMGARVESLAGALIPEVGEESGSSSLSAFLVTTGTESGWDELTAEDNEYLISDIFGDPDEGFAVVTKIRVLLEQFTGTVEELTSTDSDFDCSTTASLADSDTIDIAFYGEVSNGDADNRNYDCVSDLDDSTQIYGLDADGVARIVNMMEITDENDEQTDVRGTTVRILSTIWMTYAEEAGEDDERIGSLDLQYIQSTQYTGVDEEFGTDDDVFFKSRSRITGRAELDEDGNPSNASGDFTVTKYDQTGEENQAITKTTGRGSYGESEVSLFNIEVSLDELTDDDGIYCLEHDGSGDPAFTDGAECEDLEESYSWGSEDLPFSLSPELETEFVSKPFFEEDDLIDDLGSNFEIPEYETEE